MADSHKTRSINKFFQFVSFFPIAFFVTLIVGGSLFTFFYAKTDNLLFFFLLLGFMVFMILLFIGYTYYNMKQFKHVFVEGLYRTTVQNFEAISHNSNQYVAYPETVYNEVNDLNKQIESIKFGLSGGTLIATESSFDNIDLDYLDKENKVVTYSSFQRALSNIIFISQNYRNIIIELYYDLGEEKLTKKDIDYLLKVLRNNFSDYPNPLYILADDHRSLYLYLPRIDTLSKINEQLETALRNTTIARRKAEGITSLTGHFSVVCYPFSDVEELLPDLRYAKRQGQDIFFYLPDRVNSLKNEALLKNTMNLNIMSKIVSPLLNMDLAAENTLANVKIIDNVMKSTLAYFDLDYAGIIAFDEIKKTYSVSFQTNAANLPPISDDGHVETEFVQAMDQAKDEDNSYYFALRNHANNALGRHLDRIGLESGLYYVVKSNNVVYGVIYFFNKNKPFYIDSYVQETLTFLCNKIAYFIIKERRDREVESSFLEIDSILKLSDYATYRVSLGDFLLLRASSTFKSLFPKAKEGEKCYKALYGLDEPCQDCPLLNGSKKSMVIGKDNYETSLVLSARNTNYQVLAIKNLYTHHTHHRYHQDLIINSYHSLIETLENSYEINGKGYLLLLRLDNLEQLVEEKGSEGYLSIIRDFTRRVKKMHNGIENIYFYNNQFLALLYTEYGQTDILDECEKIYNLAQNKDRDAEYKLDLTFLPVSYPRVYPNAASLMKQADSFANRGRYEVNKNFIYFDESNYSRSANRESFLLSVIQKAFANKTFEVSLQPMVNAVDKQIYGAELLLRIIDEYRNTTFRTDELVNVAAKYNQIGIISNALLDVIGGLYRAYGTSLFSGLGFKRLCLNTDYSFFTDKNFRSDIKRYINELKLPKRFLTFEIPESDVANHIDEFKEIAKMTKEFHIVLVCDQYTGRFISLEILKQIGFDEVKISRSVVLHIDSDTQRYANLKSLLQLIRKLDMKASVVGVENLDQYLLIKECDDTVLLQGFYFYRPLEKQALIEALRGANKYTKKEDDEDKPLAN